MPAHMTLKKPRKGTATAARRSRKRAADRVLSKNAATVRERQVTTPKCGAGHIKMLTR